MSLFRTRYRIVTDSWSGFEAQYRPWWSPVWIAIPLGEYSSNTSWTVEQAERVIQLHRDREPVGRVVKVVE